MKKVIEVTKQNAVEFVDKAKRKLGPAYGLVRDLVEENAKEYSWRVIKVGKSTKYQCTRCNRVEVCARKCCPECGAKMVGEGGVVRKI